MAQRNTTCSLYKKISKNEKNYFLMAMCIIMGTICVSCNDPSTPDDDNDPFVYKAAWERELEAYINNGVFGTDLKLLHYEYLMKVETEKDIQDLYNEIFDPEALTPAYRDSSYDPKKFVMEPYAIYEKKQIETGGLFIELDYPHYVDSLLRTYPKIAELEWEYKSDIHFKTKAILNNYTNKIDYEHVIKHLIIINKSISRTITKTIPQSQELLEYEKLFKVGTSYGGEEIYAQVVIGITGNYENNSKSITGKYIIPSQDNKGFSNWTTNANDSKSDVVTLYPSDMIDISNQ